MHLCFRYASGNAADRCDRSRIGNPAFKLLAVRGERAIIIPVFTQEKIHFVSELGAQESRDVDIDNDTADDQINKQAFQESSEVTRDVAIDFNQNEIDPKGITAMDAETFYDLCEGDLSNLFKLEISSTNIEEIERSINRIKLEEEIAPTVKAINRKCGEGDGPAIVETSTFKYVEANGQLEFSRKFWKRGKG